MNPVVDRDVSIFAALGGVASVLRANLNAEITATLARFNAQVFETGTLDGSVVLPVPDGMYRTLIDPSKIDLVDTETGAVRCFVYQIVGPVTALDYSGDSMNQSLEEMELGVQIRFVVPNHEPPTINGRLSDQDTTLGVISSIYAGAICNALASNLRGQAGIIEISSYDRAAPEFIEDKQGNHTIGVANVAVTITQMVRTPLAGG